MDGYTSVIIFLMNLLIMEYPFQEPVQPLDLGIFGIQKIIMPKERIKIDSHSKNTIAIPGERLPLIPILWQLSTKPVSNIEDEKQFFVRADFAFSRAVCGIKH